MKIKDMTMTIHRTGVAAGLVLVALLGGCNRGGDTPKGQVVATVNGDDITIHELNSELALARPPADVPHKTVEQVVLARVIERKMLADAARDRKLDKNPDFILAERRVEDGLLVQALQRDIARKVPPATREAAEKYIEAHPDQFAQRKIYSIDQIQFLRPANIATLGLEKANTLADVAQILTANKIEFRHANTTVDALTVNPALVTEIGKILARNPQEVFMFADQPQGAPAPVMFVNKVIDTKITPYTGEPAIALAQQIVQREAIQKALVDSLQSFRAAAKDKIKYAAGYGPPPATPAAGAPAAASPGAAAPAATVPAAPAAKPATVPAS
jgi:EpsD family peptidyl-prolyl cis-trans isomerase